MNDINRNRIIRCMQAARDGKELTIGFFGGSITQGSLATEHSRAYAYRVFEWWEKTYPQAQLHYVNGGIGGTSSHFGTARVVKDLLMYQPDFVVVDFSVNDDEKDGLFFQETYEGVIRQILQWPSKPAVVILNNVYYDTGINAQEYHNAVADYYGIPHVSVKDTIYQRILNGEFTREELTPDNLHPNDKGHALVAGEICSCLESFRKIAEEEEQTEEAEDAIPAPFTANAYEHAVLWTIANSNPELEGFRADPREKAGHLDFFKNGWTASKTGDRIRFQVEGSCLAVQYRKTIQKPSPVARVIVDGQVDRAVILDGNFEETWGDCLYLQKILHHGKKGLHTVEIEITEAGEEDQSPFYLLSLITA
ncbi:MAG: SGNH/GDSL hydrolase family protein [Lachnospiraceae bacterium]|nr:SGNH/GDSL hydrolase family protein [Lachnospiraceae bacterium]